MYLTSGGLLQGLGKDASCSGWERDHESLGKLVAEHHVRMVLGRVMRAKNVWCGKGGNTCEVYFPDSITVMVSFAKVPGTLLARQIAKGAPVGEYAYECTPEGQIVFRPK